MSQIHNQGFPHECVRRHRSFSARPDPISAHRASGLGFVAQPSNPAILWWTTANPACRLRSWAATLHRLMPTTSSCFSCHHAARTWPHWPPGPSRRAYLSLHSSEAPQGVGLSRSLFTCTNANQAATCTCNTRPRVNPHHIVNHSSQPGVTIHRSSNAQVLTYTHASEDQERPSGDGWPLLSDEWLTMGVGLTLGLVRRCRLRPSSCCCRWRTGAKGLQPWDASGRWRDK
jgi:hypothetical protein